SVSPRCRPADRRAGCWRATCCAASPCASMPVWMPARLPNATRASPDKSNTTARCPRHLSGGNRPGCYHRSFDNPGGRTMKAADLFVRALEEEGVEYVFGVPGEENLDLVEALRQSSIDLIITRHEQAAGFMAATCGRLTGKPGVCLSTLGPGATNLVTAAGYAQLGAMPMVMITGQKPIRNNKQALFQIIDVVDMMRPLTKFTESIPHGDAIPSRVREAFRQAEEERPGACHLELPEDVAQDHSTMPVVEASYTRRPIAEDKAI